MAKILVIEDNHDIRENLVEILELQGHAVHVAENGNKGLTLAQMHLPELILCDILMPELNGFDVLRQLKEHPATSSIPFIFVTASAEKKEIEAGIDQGASAYIRKPFETQELLNVIEDFLT